MDEPMRTRGFLACPRGVPHGPEHRAQHLIDTWCPVTGRWTCFTVEAAHRLAQNFPEWPTARIFKSPRPSQEDEPHGPYYVL